jgi:hypothetical protein
MTVRRRGISGRRSCATMSRRSPQASVGRRMTFIDVDARPPACSAGSPRAIGAFDSAMFVRVGHRANSATVQMRAANHGQWRRCAGRTHFARRTNVNCRPNDLARIAGGTGRACGLCRVASGRRTPERGLASARERAGRAVSAPRARSHPRSHPQAWKISANTR